MIVTARILLVVALASAVALGVPLTAQPPRPAQAPAPEARPGPAEPLYKLDEAFLRWPLAKADASYGTIDGRRLQTFVNDFVAMSRKYRDAGHPQFWGRIIGTSADEASQAYLLERFKQIGMADVRLQSFDLPLQWMPQSWNITVSGGSRSVQLTAAHPIYGTPATPAGGLDTEAVWLGTGTEADYRGRDVKDKAAVIGVARRLTLLRGWRRSTAPPPSSSLTPYRATFD